MRIEIVSRPDGEAPEWVRDAWIGLELRALNRVPEKILGFGVLSGPKSRLGEWFGTFVGRTVSYEGFIVDAVEAVQSLSLHNSEAARWWRENCSHILEPGGSLMFRSQECKVLD
jgi:hypothetical protein